MPYKALSSKRLWSPNIASRFAYCYAGCHTQHNNNKNATLSSVVMLSAIYAECRKKRFMQSVVVKRLGQPICLKTKIGRAPVLPAKCPSIIIKFVN